MKLNLLGFQQQRLDELKDKANVAFYWDMGTGKTFVGAEKLMQLGNKINLLICQKSKIDDWVKHFKKYYPLIKIIDLSSSKLARKTVYGAKTNQLQELMIWSNKNYELPCVAIINYELAFRRPELLKLENFTLMLDESSLIQNETTKRAKFILKMKKKNVVLLSGTPTNGKYEKLWSQVHLLGWEEKEDSHLRELTNYYKRLNENGGN